MTHDTIGDPEIVGPAAARLAAAWAGMRKWRTFSAADLLLMRLRTLPLAFALAAAPGLALAHHGQDFLLLESPTVPHPGSLHLIANSRVMLESGAEEQAEFAPALLFGVSPRVAFELHAHTEKLSGEGWKYEATAPAIHILLTDPEREDGFKLGLSAEYEIAAEDGAPNNSELRLSMENGDEKTKWGANLIASREQGGDSDFGASLGLRHTVAEGFALGVEAESSLRHAEGAQLLAGAYWDRPSGWGWKLGLGGERGEDGDISPVLHLGVILPLH